MLTISTTAAVARSCAPVIWLPPPAARRARGRPRKVRGRQRRRAGSPPPCAGARCSPRPPSPNEKTIASTAAGSAKHDPDPPVARRVELPVVPGAVREGEVEAAASAVQAPPRGRAARTACSTCSSDTGSNSPPRAADLLRDNEVRALRRPDPISTAWCERQDDGAPDHRCDVHPVEANCESVQSA